jgi:hypothetical protein
LERSIELVSKAYALDTRSESDAKNESSEKNESDAKSVSERVSGRVDGRDCFAISIVLSNLGFSRYAMKLCLVVVLIDSIGIGYIVFGIKDLIWSIPKRIHQSKTHESLVSNECSTDSERDTICYRSRKKT